MSEFVTLLNPIFERVTGKQVIDPEGRTTPIGVSLSGMHFIDAFELVLDRQRLGFRETDNYFIVEALPEDGEEVQLVGTDGVSSRAEGAAPPATALSREIRIDAYIFELNVTRLRDTGTNWTTVFGGEAGGTSSASASGGAGSGGVQAGLNFELKTDSFFDSFSTFLEGPDRVNFKEIVSLFRYFESIDVGETIASPSVAVQSGETGRIQSGSDIPVTIQDFAGNTITQYIPTGVIIEVVPTLIADASDQRDDPEALPVEFIHLDVNVEKSSGRISSAGVTIDKNKTDTQVLLLDGEQTVIGGLFSTEEATFRKGIPILKSIPLVKYLFSYQSKSVVQKELLIALQARVVEPLRARAGRPYPTNLYERERQDIQRRLDRFKPGAGDDFDLIEAGEMD
jgi:type IV pilus assembly protein PilQ